MFFFFSLLMLLYNHMCLLIWTVFSGERCGPWASCFYRATAHLTRGLGFSGHIRRKANSFLSYDKQGILRTDSCLYPNEFLSQRCNRSDLSWPYTIVYRTHNLPYTRRTTWFVNPWLLHVSKILFIFTGPLASALCNRFTCRTVVMVGGVLLCVGVLVSGFAPSLEFLYFSYSLIGGKKIDQILL